MKKRLFLIDGNSLINRAFYALPPLTNAAGEPTNAVYGLVMMLFRLRDDYNPDRTLVAFDVSGPTFRHHKFPEYKAHRKGMPDDLRPQIGVAKEVLDALGISRLEKQGFEADDLIGTVARQGEEEGYEVFIVTGDRDAFQLVSPQTQVLYTKRGITETELINEESLKKSYGLEARQIVEMKGLMGDSSDNIPGVTGVGEKTALKLLAEYDTIAGVYEHLAEIKGKLQERLSEQKELALLSRELATIDRQAPVKVDFDQQEEIKAAEARTLFLQLGFRTLLERLPAEGPGEETKWDLSHTLLDEANLPRFIEQLNQATQVYVAGGFEQPLACLFSDQAWLISPAFWPQCRLEIREIWRGKEIYCIASKELQHLCETGLDPLPVAFDLELALYCLNPEQSWDWSELSGRFGRAPGPLADQPDFPVFLVRLLAESAPSIEEELEENGLSSLVKDLEIPLAAVLAAMETKGILVDPRKLQEFSQELESTLTRLTKTIHEQAGEEFNINSPKQLGVILFEKMGLPVLRKTKTGPSTSAAVLEELGDYPIVGDVLQYRQVAKLKSTYADALLELIAPVTKRIHTTFNQTVTATGRLSSTHPNLQNIPVRTAEGRKVRQAFVAPEGYYLLSADYSQIELRVLAHVSEDENLLTAFRSGQDIHSQTAAEVFGVEIGAVNSEQRKAAKAINFGIIYGISSFGLAKGINLTPAQAQAYIDAYFERYPKVKAYLDDSIKSGEKQGYVQTILGRRRYLPGLKSRNFNVRSFAQRTAMNSPIQGSAADLIKMAMIQVAQALKESEIQAQLLLQVHDELVLEVAKEDLAPAALLIKEKMEGVLSLKVPLIVDVFYGENWRDVQPFNFEEMS